MCVLHFKTCFELNYISKPSIRPAYPILEK